MTTSKKRNPCARCTVGRAIATCNGCQEMLCYTHFNEHRDELSNLMDNIIVDHDSLRHDLNEETIEHPLLSRIDHWEKESIQIIQTAAQTTRTKLQEWLTKKKQGLTILMDGFTADLQARQDSTDYTEIEINKWTEKIKSFRDMLSESSSIDLETNEDPQSMIRLIKISDTQLDNSLSLVLSSENSPPTLQPLSSLSDEKFDQISREAFISEDDLTAIFRPRIGALYSQFVYGVNRYSSGSHSIRFSIEKKGSAPIFFGIITGTKKYGRSLLSANNSSVYGWHNMQSFVISGKSQKYPDENLLQEGDHVILMIDCEELQIGLQHQTTKRSLQIPVSLDKCPFPWKLICGLQNVNDSIRIIHGQDD